MAIKETRQIRYDALARGTTNFVPYWVVSQNDDVNDPTGNINDWQKETEYKIGDQVKIPFNKDHFYLECIEDHTSLDAINLDHWKVIGEYIPYNLQGCILMFTVKKKAYDADEYSRTSTPTTYWKQLRDVSSENGMDDSIFRITIDCDDPTAGEISPLWAREGNGFKEVFHGMYGADPKLGFTTFRIPKGCTFVDPGSYYFDIRIMLKSEQRIGDLLENTTYLQAFGYLDIYGTPNNRATTFNPFLPPVEDEESILQ